jgi:hypothetical protein
MLGVAVMITRPGRQKPTYAAVIVNLPRDALHFWH